MYMRKKEKSDAKLIEVKEKQTRLVDTTMKLLMEATGKKSMSQFDGAQVKNIYDQCLDQF